MSLVGLLELAWFLAGSLVDSLEETKGALWAPELAEL
jgi:hypothetical protein